MSIARSTVRPDRRCRRNALTGKIVRARDPRDEPPARPRFFCVSLESTSPGPHPQRRRRLSSKLTPEVSAGLIRAKRDGLTNDAAAKVTRVLVRTLQMWLKLGRAGDVRYQSFAELFDTAEEAALNERAQAILRAGCTYSRSGG